MTENPQELVRYAALAVQCLTTLGILGSIIFGWTGYKKYAKPFAEPASPKAEEMNNRDAGKTMLTVAVVVLILSLIGSCLGFGLTLASPSAQKTPATQTAPVPDDQSQPDQPNAPKPVFNAPGDLEVTDTTIYANQFYIRADIIYFNEAKTRGEVRLNVGAPLFENMTIGPSYDGNPMHERRAWTSTNGQGWPYLYKDMCQLAEDITHGYINSSTDFSVLYPDGNGGYYAVNKVPDCKKVPLYTGD